ncbi:MAG TPA: UDP-N-acetylmuramate:L-alanyl-gamma-D-glutamyl-meso-diaminopimelate ligase [Plasticicumulans sp.]|uniref:UDP-N-acetylmuramate:L-alanyl-gamma-D-glutamyl- meso-diaminopimelate ligase n=1 Tax=Plasticicumulans sp. TaxID=2307179 RepID=UPI002CC69EA4|nr:UDP-N-acetylmuramate:L-alanyl-gamma-D-glutamyl-meso-diaminopimelate ligase [Plasticicumulans sp.]HNG48361.1 UDP-N-acetylmuramate:L-alanyl-gamma-D-glutamyl-meso-diaminopimelate ligase [Plasticicumulans sp.]
MHLHILGICGTFMAGVALLAREAGHTVSGCDANVYPPMSTQLEAAGIRLTEGFDPAQLDLAAPDVVVVGNVMRRGLPIVETLLDRGLPYTSGPQWLAEHILHGRWPLAVAGTHGKTTTSSMLAWILEDAGLAPGFLIGGIPANFGVSARLGSAPFFVVEADEYDTAFFDKRSKFVHYRPRTAVLNNLEYDHADIFPDLAAIQRQFHHLVRTVPGGCGRLVVEAGSAALGETLAMGCWTPVERFGPGGDWTAAKVAADGSAFDVQLAGERLGRVEWPLLGAHNVANALAAIAAARHAGVRPQDAIAALGRFRGVARRMELRGEAAGVRVYDDFAHHPSAIATTLAGLRASLDAGRRIVAVLEPRSNTMKLGVFKDALAGSLAAADAAVFHAAPDLGWDLAASVASMGSRASIATTIDATVAAAVARVQPGDVLLVMSNGGFGGIHGRLLVALAGG